jgi:predicted ester cyclase
LIFVFISAVSFCVILLHLVIKSKTIISVVKVTGKHAGDFLVIPPSGNRISYQAVHIHRIGNDGKIAEHKSIRDDLSLMVQLGVVGPKSAQYEPLFQAWKKFKDTQ